MRYPRCTILKDTPVRYSDGTTLHPTNLDIAKARLQEALGTPYPAPPIEPLVAQELHKAATAQVEAYLLSGIAVGALLAYAGLVTWTCYAAWLA